jgi:hypothetical protein
MKAKKRTEQTRAKWEWKRWQQEFPELTPLVANLNNGDPEFDDLRGDVGTLLDCPPIPPKATTREMSPAEYWLRRVAAKIVGMKFNNSRRSVIPVPTGSRLRLGDQWFIFAEVPDMWNAGKRGVGYFLLDRTLRSGEFSYVRRCRVCGKFFLSFREKAYACDAKCNRVYQNRRYQAEGKFMDSYRKRKENELKKARRLKREGKGIDYVVEHTDVTRLALIKANIFRKDD